MRNISKFLKKLPIYWYPGSANDLTPLLLMYPDHHRYGMSLVNLHTVLATCKDSIAEDAAILWLVEKSPCRNLKSYFEDQRKYKSLWKRFGATHRIGNIEQVEIDSLTDNYQHSIVEIEILRHRASETYTFLFTEGDAREMLTAYLLPENVNLKWVAIIDSHGFSGDIDTLPKLLCNDQSRVMPEAFILDARWTQKQLSDVGHLYRPNEEKGLGVSGWGHCSASIRIHEKFAKRYARIKLSAK